MLTKETVVDKVEILEDGAIQIREATYLVEDGVRGPLLGYHRSAKRPGEDVTAAHDKVKAVAAVVWTPEVLQAEEDRQKDAVVLDVKRDA